MDRRTFLSGLTVAAGTLAGALVGIPLLGRLTAPLRRSASPQDGFRSLGPLSSFEPGQPVRVVLPVTVRDGWEVTTQQRAAWVVRGSDGSVAILSTVCPHLGCSVTWAPRQAEFACPCHDSGFAPDGARRHGPARRGLDALPTRIVGDDLQVAWVDYVANIAEKRPVGGASAAAAATSAALGGAAGGMGGGGEGGEGGGGSIDGGGPGGSGRAPRGGA